MTLLGLAPSPLYARNHAHGSTVTNSSLPTDLFEVVAPVLTAERKARFKAVAARRLPWLRCVLQDVHGVHNISACLRSCEALGVGEVDILSVLNAEDQITAASSTFRPSSVACGINHWLNIRSFQSLQDYADFLHARNFKLFAGKPHTASPPAAVSLADILHDSWQAPYGIAVLFGNERHGIHPHLAKYIHNYFSIPTSGFVESFNVSVAAAITLHQLTHEAQTHYAASPRLHLSPQQIKDQLNLWTARSYPHWQTIYLRQTTSA